MLHTATSCIFLAEVQTSGSELWKTDGTVDGTQLIKKFDYNRLGNAHSLIVYKDNLYFIAIQVHV